jgi:hypothetical protein
LTTKERKLFPQGSVYGIGENNMVETDHGLIGRSLPNRIQSKTEFYHILQYETTFHRKQFERKRIGSLPKDTDLKENTYFYIILE